MRIITFAITIFLLFCFNQAIFGQNSDVTTTSEKPIVCFDCFYHKQNIIFSPKIEYPKAAMAVNVSGKVQVSVFIDENGNVIEAKAVSGHPLLQAAAVKAALQTKYEIFKLNGKPILAYGVIDYNFIPNEVTQTKESEAKTQIAPTPKEKVIRILPQGVLIGKAIKLSKPQYISCNCRFGIVKGIINVIVQAEIDEKGNVSKATAISGHPVLKFKSEQAAKNSKFSPSVALGVPVKTKTLIVYRFTIVDKWSVRLKDINVKDTQIENSPTS
jgi:TonB family protein